MSQEIKPVQEQQPEQHININQQQQPPEQHININHNEHQTPPQPHRISLTTQQNIIREDRWKLDSIKNGIIILCSLFATFCFEAMLNPPGGVWQDSQTTDKSFLNTTIANQISHQSINNKHVRRLIKMSQLGGRIPKLNLTNPEIFGPGKAVSIVMYPREFLRFLGWNSLCYLTSLTTVVLVMLTTSFETFFPGGLVLIMTGLVILSAVKLYWSVLVLVSDNEFGHWASSIGGAPLRIASALFLVYLVVEKRQELMDVIKKIFDMVWEVWELIVSVLAWLVAIIVGELSYYVVVVNKFNAETSRKCKTPLMDNNKPPEIIDT